MSPPGVKAFEQRTRTLGSILSSRDKKSPIVYQRPFKANRTAWEFFRAQAPWYQRTSTFWVVSAKQEETRQRRLATLMSHAEKGAGSAYSRNRRKCKIHSVAESLLAGNLRKIDDIQVQPKLSMTGLGPGQKAAPTPLCCEPQPGPFRRNRPSKSEAVDEVRDSIGRERGRALHEMGMQMRRRGVPAVAKLASTSPRFTCWPTVTPMSPSMWA